MVADSKEKNNIETLLINRGMPFDDARIVADCLVTADLYGVESHGSKTINAHLNKIDANEYNLHPKFDVEIETPSFARINGDNSIGFVSAFHCLKFAMERAKQNGVYTVFSNNNNTFGPAFYYSLQAAKNGCIAFICSNSPAQMLLPGGKKKILGTNPFSMVIPVPGKEPIIIDMATSVVAKSRFKQYKENGKTLPDGWALDEYGNPTNDPDEAIRGSVLPMAGIKGSAISLLIDVISGVLSGASYLSNVGRFYGNPNCMNVGFFITVFEPSIITSGNYSADIQSFYNLLKNSKGEGETVIIPGDDRNAIFKEKTNGKK